MKPELKSKWVAALRSGEYKQARRKLCAEGGFCCLGVLLDVSDAGEWIGEEFRLFGNYNGRYNLDMELDYTARDLLGVPGKAESVLIAMNDDENKSFAEIADFVETHL